MRTVSYKIHNDEHPDGREIYLIEEVTTLHLATGDEFAGWILPDYHTSRAAAEAAVAELAGAQTAGAGQFSNL